MNAIALPISGIGTGIVSLSGSGELKDWEIFNRPGKGIQLPYTFFSIWCGVEGSQPTAKVLEAVPSPPYTGSHGYDRSRAQGLPRFRSCKFKGEYPFAWVCFSDDLLVSISLEAFNPLIPLNEKDSGLPVAIMRYRLRNRSRKKINVTVCASICNAVGHDGKSKVGRLWSGFGQNLNEPVREGKITSIRMSSAKYDPSDPRFGTMAIATDWPKVTTLVRWPRGPWWDDIQSFWDDFSEDGKFDDVEASDPTPDGMTDICSLGLMAELEPGEEVTLPFFITWHFPTRLNEWDKAEPFHLKPLRNYYASRFSDAWDVARYIINNFDRLYRETKEFHDALFNSTLPPAIIDAVSSQISTIRTNTCFRLANGDFFGFEGCGESQGCCPMNCTHVWNYAQAVAYLFPSLERSMRTTDFLVNTEEDGKMAFRTKLPTTSKVPWTFHAAADGQMGCIIRLYREWKLSGDIEFLERLWPAAKRALEYAWKPGGWDPDRDGVIDGVQHNTYDIEFVGPNTLTGTLYLAALKAAAEMARILGDNSVDEYLRIFENGSKKYDELLWNGEYYVQKLENKDDHKYQYGDGCLSDQLIGQWLATQLGLGYVLPRDRVRKALNSVFRYNWKKNLSNHHNVQRIYALGNEPGLLVCTWPKGGRPKFPVPYCDEVWTGIEYQVASHMIYEGMAEEGLKIVEGARSRHDGAKRNPWNEFECGDHYARAMSSYSLLLAMSGFLYDAPSASLTFSPIADRENFRCFFSCRSGWGVVGQHARRGRMEFFVDLRHGTANLMSVKLRRPYARPSRRTRCVVKIGNKKVRAEARSEGGYMLIEFPEQVHVDRRHRLTVTTSPGQF